MSERVATALLAGLLVVSAVASIPGTVGGQQVPQTGQESGQVIGSPDLSFATSTGELAPGATTEMSIAVTNRGEIRQAGPERHQQRVTTARGVTLTVDDDDAPIDVAAGTISVGNVPDGTVPTDPVEVSVANDAEPGTYEVPIEYEYQYTRVASYGPGGTEYRDRTRSTTGELEVQVRDQPRFAVVDVDSAAQVGGSGDVALTLQNTGDETATDASVTLASQSASLSFDAGAESATADVGEWGAGENRTVTVSATTARGSPGRSYATELTVEYTDPSGIDRTTSPRKLGIPVADEQTFAFEDVDAQLRVGEEGTVSGTITNTGPQTANNVVVQYADNASTLVPVDESAAVGALEPGESATFSLPIEVVSEARAGSKSVSFAARYRNANGDRGQYANLDVVADVAPERDQFTAALQNRTIDAGDSRAVTVEIANNMNQTASDVEARLFAEDPLDAGDDNEGFIESIDAGETVTLAYQLEASSSATPGRTYPVSMDFRYDDERGNSHLSNQVRIPVDVTESEGGGLPLGVFAAVGLALVGVGAAVRYRRG